MRGFIGGAWFYSGACMVLFGGRVWFYSGGCMVLFGGACMVLFRGHAWFYLGGMHGFIQGGVHGFIWGACMVLFGGCAWFYSGCVVLFRGHAWFYSGGHAWFYSGGMCGFSSFFGYNEIRSMSGRYASYWNAFLFHRPLSVILFTGGGWEGVSLRACWDTHTPPPRQVHPQTTVTAADGTHPTPTVKLKCMVTSRSRLVASKDRWLLKITFLLYHLFSASHDPIMPPFCFMINLRCRAFSSTLATCRDILYPKCFHRLYLRIVSCPACTIVVSTLIKMCQV